MIRVACIAVQPCESVLENSAGQKAFQLALGEARNGAIFRLELLEEGRKEAVNRAVKLGLSRIAVSGCFESCMSGRAHGAGRIARFVPVSERGSRPDSARCEGTDARLWPGALALHRSEAKRFEEILAVEG